MRKFNTFVHSVLLFTSPAFFAYPQNGHASQPQINIQELPYANFNLTYDEVLRLLRDIEEGRIDKLSEEELEKISRFITYLAQIGLLRRESAAALAELQNDIAALLEDEEDFFDFDPSSDAYYAYTILPTVLSGKEDGMICKRHKHKHKHSKKHKKNILKKIKHFVKKHRKAIIIGAVIVVAAAAVAIAVLAAPATAGAVAATAASAAAASAPALAQPDKKESSSPAPDPNSMPAESTAVFETQVFALKEKIGQSQFFQSADPVNGQQGLSWEEDGRIVGSLLAHDALQGQMPYPGQASSYAAHPEIDNKFSTDYTLLFTNPIQEANFNTLSDQLRGETALKFGYYNQAVYDFGKAIDANPTNPIPYLERGIAHFSLGDYEHSLRDYQQYTIQAPMANPVSITEFSIGFAKEFPRGIYESGEGMLLFLADFVAHPIHTSAQVIQAVDALVQLARSEQWGLIAEALSPEVHQVITQWGSLSWEEKGRLLGYAVGKHGMDFFGPAAAVKLISKGVKFSQEFAAISKNMRLAQETLILETAAEIGSSAKIAEVVETGQRVSFLGEELGFSAREMGQLKQAGSLETTIAKNYEHLSLPRQESIQLYQRARESLKPYVKKPMPEHQVRMYIHETGIPTFPRPKGVPENYIVRITERGAGMEYIHPTNTHLSVRVMPGKSHSPFPYQQEPYVIQMKDGKAFDKYGNLVLHETPEAHIPINEFIYRE